MLIIVLENQGHKDETSRVRALTRTHTHLPYMCGWGTFLPKVSRKYYYFWDGGECETQVNSTRETRDPRPKYTVIGQSITIHFIQRQVVSTCFLSTTNLKYASLAVSIWM